MTVKRWGSESCHWIWRCSKLRTHLCLLGWLARLLQTTGDIGYWRNRWSLNSFHQSLDRHFLGERKVGVQLFTVLSQSDWKSLTYEGVKNDIWDYLFLKITTCSIEIVPLSEGSDMFLLYQLDKRRLILKIHLVKLFHELILCHMLLRYLSIFVIAHDPSHQSSVHQS